MNIGKYKVEFYWEFVSGFNVGLEVFNDGVFGRGILFDLGIFRCMFLVDE